MKIRVIVTLSIAFLCRAAFAAAPCDENLRPDSNQTGYQMRDSGIRCEGIYIARVSRNSDSLTLVGLTRGRIEFGSKDRVVLRSALPDRTIYVRGVGIAERTYYRLDGMIRGDGSFEWPLTDVVQIRQLRADQIGLTGFFDKPTRGERIYVPIDFGGSETVIQIAGSELFSRAYWRSTQMTAGLCGKMPEWIALETPRFDDEPFEINLPNTLGPEICLEVTALPTQGNTWISDRWKIQSGQ